MTSPLLALPGAVEGSAPDAGVAWHYGDPLGEQRESETGAGWCDRSHRDVLTVTGPDRLVWLHSLLSQHLSELPALEPTEALLLDPHGRVQEHLQVIDDGVTTWLDVEPGHGPALQEYLQRMVFWSNVEVRAADVAVISVLGPDAQAVVAAAEPGELVRRRAPWPAAGGIDLLLPREAAERSSARLSAAGARPIGTWAYEALRVAAGVPRLGFETDDKTIPHEVGWIGSAVHLHKGCYRGQETVARVQNLGRPPRRLVLLHLDGSEVAIPAHGAPVVPAAEEAGRPVGWIGTAVRHYELGPIALAVVKRSVADDAELQILAEGRPISARIDPVVRAG